MIDDSETTPVRREPNWRLMYAIVLGELALLVLLFTIFTRTFS